MSSRTAAKVERSIGKRIAALLTVAGAISMGGASAADDVNDIRTAVTEPLAIRGGVLMLPLDARRHGTDWPASLDLKLSDGTVLKGRVAWIEESTDRAAPHWTAPLRPLAVRDVTRTDDSSGLEPGLGPVLLVELPDDGDGDIRLEGQKLRPVWLDRPLSAFRAGETEVRGAMVAATGPQWPDPIAPAEYWRWALLAGRTGATPPPVEQFGEPGSLVARHVADLWQIAMARLAQIDPDLAQRCLHLLTMTGRDGARTIAMWPTEERDVGALLNVLLNRSARDDAIRKAAAAWLEMRSPIVAWPEVELHTAVRIAIINRSADVVSVRFTWLRENVEATAALLEPGVLTRVEIERPMESGRVILRDVKQQAPARQDLLVECGSWQQQFAFGQRVVEARPPGVSLPPLIAPLSLAEIQAQQRRIVPTDRSTFVSVRRLDRRWEVFMDCRRPAPADHTRHDGNASERPPAEVAGMQNAARGESSRFEQLRGTEAVALVLGSGDLRGEEERIVIVPESGFHEVVGGSPGDVQIHRRSYADRWYARVVLPDDWLVREDQAPLLLGCVRSHGDGAELELGPGSALPWRLDPGRAVIDLTPWDDLPSPSP
jgi:hypothetical protein